jgi:transposase, IS6 family
VKGKWRYLYRAVDSKANTIDFLLAAKRDKEAAKRFQRKTMENSHHSTSRVLNVDKNPVYPIAIEELKAERSLSKKTNLRQCNYLNNIVEQDHRFIKRRVNPGLGFWSFHIATRTLRGYEAMNMIRKGQVMGVAKGVTLSLRSNSLINYSQWLHKSAAQKRTFLFSENLQHNL